MSSEAPTTRGILRRSSYQSTASSDASSSVDFLAADMDDMSLTVDTSSSTASSPSSSPMKPQRRDVGKVERPSRPARGTRKAPPGRSISFSDDVEERQVPIIPRSKSGEFFYDEDEIAQFRHEKFMEDAGLDPVTYEPISLW